MLTVDELLAATATEPRSDKAEERDRALFAAAVALPAFTTQEVADRTGCRHWYGAASLLMRTLHRQGALRIVSPEGVKPFVYAWVGGPVADLAALRSQFHVDPSAATGRYVAALEAEVDRLRGLVGEPPLTETDVAA